MQKATYSTLALSVIAATAVLAVAIAPALIQSAAADAIPKRTEIERCNDPKFADRESCPGNSENAQGNDREDENICIARNQGQAKDCPEGSTIVFATR